MALPVMTAPHTNDLVTSSLWITNFGNLQTFLNGNITDANFSPNANVQPSKFSGLASLYSTIRLGTPYDPSIIPTFTGIPQTATSLLVIAYGRTSTAALENGISFRVNGDSGTNYYSEELRGSLAVASSNGGNANVAHCGFFPGSTAPAGDFGCFVLRIHRYREVGTFAKNRPYRSLAGSIANTGTAARVSHYSGQWKNSVNAITSLTFSEDSGGTFFGGSVFSLYLE